MSRRKYNVNDDYFKKWSHNMAYALGFFCADGCVDYRRNIFRISQHKKDEYILKSILKDMGSNNPLHKHKGNNNKAFFICSTQIVNDLRQLGARPNKTHAMIFPNIPRKYLRDFIRGLWDGDGSVFMLKNKNRNGNKSIVYFSSYVSANNLFVKKLLETLELEINGFNGTLKSNKKYTRILVGINNTRRLRDYLYKNIRNKLYLKRKYKRFLRAGKIKVANRDIIFKSFEDARSLVRKLKLKNNNEWCKYKKSSHRPSDIPYDPRAIYGGKGWLGIKDWLGTEGVFPPRIVFLPFEEARLIARKLKLRGWTEWINYSPSKKKIHNIPSAPNKVYKNSGWISMADFLGAKRYCRSEK